MDPIDPRYIGLIEELAVLSGIMPYYYDLWGRQRHSPLESKISALHAMGIEISEESLRNLNNIQWLNPIRPVIVVSETAQPEYISVSLPSESSISVVVRITDEDGSTQEISTSAIQPIESSKINGRKYERFNIPIGEPRPIGYYDIFIETSPNISLSTKLIIAPGKCHLPKSKRWGVNLNLYALRSKENWGVGDLEDLRNFVKMSASLGADFTGINPLHAISNNPPAGVSPYFALSRVFSNFIYIRPDSNEDFEETIDSEIKKLQESEFINYKSVAELKLKHLASCFDTFMEKHYMKQTERGRSFSEYLKDSGEPLKLFGSFMSIAHKLGGIYDALKWPEEYRSPDSPKVQSIMQTGGKRVLFHAYLEWLLDEGLGSVAKTAQDVGMSIGIYGDLAIGSIKGGFDEWAFPDMFASGMTVGAPPDDFCLSGQEWGIVPLDPMGMQQNAYSFFIETLRKNMRHFGALRIDHALGLFRQFWVPAGKTPDHGVYVNYPHEDLLRIIALESVRNKTVIVAEDLGTVGNDVKNALQSFGMLSYKLLYFERQWPNRNFLHPHDYPEMSLSAVTTHDLPTLSGWWAVHDIEVKKAIGSYPDEQSAQNQTNERLFDKELLLNALKETVQGFDASSDARGVLIGAHEYLSMTNSLLVSVSLDDILMTLDQQNMPGTVASYPNWSRKTPIDVNMIFNQEMVKSVLEAIRKHRG